MCFKFKHMHLFVDFKKEKKKKTNIKHTQNSTHEKKRLQDKKDKFILAHEKNIDIFGKRLNKMCVFIFI